MHLSKAMLSLPPSLLVLVLAAAAAAQQHHPTAIRKMSLDEGEKIFPEYYAFGPAPLPLPQQARALAPDDAILLSGNSSVALPLPFQPPYPRHYAYLPVSPSMPKPRIPSAEEGAAAAAEEKQKGRKRGEEEQKEGESAGSLLHRRAREVLTRLRGRQFACPEGTHACANIGQPNYCCTTGTTCFVVTNAPDAGNVGCCPDGQNCGVTVGACAGGATACSADQGGGCCIPGFVCAEVGCVSSTVSVITQTTVTSTVVPPTPSPTTQVITVIVTVTPPGGGAPVTSTTTQTTTAGTPTSTSTSTTATTNTGGVPPYRPTSGSSNPNPTNPSPTDTPPQSYCPTGFYPCIASAGGGCCRTGRDCSTTSCPAPPAMTTIISNGATIAVPVTDAAAAASATAGTSASCAAGWFLCGGDAGPVAGCCPLGYGCGTASCTLSASTATATVQKELPSSAAGGGRARAAGVVVVGVAVAVGLFASVVV
ncbi:hypothetical protein GGR54DRAFT_508130 [Hypoxylon sp. NC1633]|nr:hypothetical protein GGR54DRAFT_508130 [Hypoxylon sp. NC1633]